MTQSHWLGLADTFQKNKSCLVANSRMPGSGSFLRSLKASGEKGQVRGDPGLRVTLHCQLQFHLGRRLRGLFPSAWSALVGWAPFRRPRSLSVPPTICDRNAAGSWEVWRQA